MTYKLPNETHLEYKRRVIDTKSASFCGAKWLNATIWLGSGKTTSCHLPPAHHIDVDELAKNPSAIHNTPHKKKMRKMMQEGERPSECDYCWKLEDIGRDNISDRVFKTVIFPDEKLDEVFHADWQDNTSLETLEIAFDRTCNFACSYCNAGFSTTWGKDIKENGPYEDLVARETSIYKNDGTQDQPYKVGEFNPYVDAFWRWWPELSKTLKELRITGGEPLMSPDVWKLFEYFGNNDTDMRFAINSNLGGKPDLIERLITESHNVKNFDLYTSCEAYGEHAEYIRDGLKWDYYTDNCKRILEHGNVKTLHMMMTINGLCLFSLTDFLEELLEWKEKHGKYKVMWTANLVRFPSFMSPLALPDHIKQDRREHLSNWLEEHKDNPLIVDSERDTLLRLVDYLEVVEVPSDAASHKKAQWYNFKRFYQQYDKRRNLDLGVFPKILTDWVDQIE